MWGKETVSDPFHYQEWDYQIQLHRPDWATVYERRQPRGHVDDIQLIIDEYRPVAHRIQQIIDLLTPEGVQRVRNMEDGDEVDINAAIDAMIAIRMGAALRHAGQHLLKQQEKHKLVLMVTDGAPADIDERDPQHLRHDTKKAVEELYSTGVLTYCLTLDPSADDYV